MPLRRIMLAAAALTLFAFACAPAGEGPGPAAAGPPPAATTPPPAPARSAQKEELDAALCAPLLIEQDLGFGTHVVMRRLPDASDISDLATPADFAGLSPLQNVVMPPDVQLVVLLPGWPPSRAALDAWNLLGGGVRLIMIVDGPPADRSLIMELNRVRNLERVIAQMERPDRSGFERLQRPLSFRVVRD